MTTQSSDQVDHFRCRLNSLKGSLKGLLLEFESGRLHKTARSQMNHERKCIEAALKELCKERPLSSYGKSRAADLDIGLWGQK